MAGSGSASGSAKIARRDLNELMTIDEDREERDQGVEDEDGVRGGGAGERAAGLDIAVPFAMTVPSHLTPVAGLQGQCAGVATAAAARLGGGMGRMAYADVLADMIAVAREAGALTLQHFPRFREIEIGIKGPADFVSDADRELELLIRERLPARYPDWSFTGEEFPPGAAPTPSTAGWSIRSTARRTSSMAWTTPSRSRSGAATRRWRGALQSGGGRDVHGDPRRRRVLNGERLGSARGPMSG